MAAPRLAVRAVIVEDGRLLLVNAYPGATSALWCAPGGGVERGTSLHANLVREVWEETGLTVAPGPLVLVNEFHEPGGDFHQVDLFFAADVVAGDRAGAWTDPEGVVNRRGFFSADQIVGMEVKPDRLLEVAFGAAGAAIYDGLEPLVPPGQ